MYRLYVVHTNANAETNTEYYPNLTKKEVNRMIDKYCEITSPELDKNNNLFWQMRDRRTDMTVINNDTNKTVCTSDNSLLTP